MPAKHRHAVVGYGRLAQALVPALQAAGETVVVGRRSPGSGELSAQEAAHVADWVWLTVPDDHIAAVAASLAWRPGQLALHCSGATPLTALSPAPAVAGFHPLQLLAGEAGARLANACVGIEAGDSDRPALRDLARRLGLVALDLPAPMSTQARAAYHAAANLAASGVLAVLAEAVSLWSSAGLPPDHALQALLPLTRGTLGTLESRGLAGAVSGPIARGDVRVLTRHLEALAMAGLDEDLLLALGRRQLALAESAGRLDAAQVHALRELLASR